LEEPTDAFRGNDEASLLLEVGGDLLETQGGILDIFDEHENGGLRAQPARWGGRLSEQGSLALPPIEQFFGGQVSKLPCDCDSIQHSALVQVGQDGMARVLQLEGEFSSRQSGGTASDQITDGGGQTAAFGKADLLVMPEAVAVKVR